MNKILKNMITWVLHKKKFLIEFFFLGIILFFLIRTYSINLTKLSLKDLSFSLIPFLLSIFLLIFGILLQSLIWSYISHFYKIGTTVLKDSYIWIVSIIGKYIPGKIFLYLGRYYFYAKEKKNESIKMLYLYAFLTEILSSVFSSIFIFLFSLIFMKVDIPLLSVYKKLALIFIFIMPGIIFLMNSSFVKKILVFIFKDKAILGIRLKYSFIFKTISFYIVSWMFYAFAFYFFIKSFQNLDVSILYVAGTFSFSIVIGMLAIFAPSGLGVRESILLLMIGVIATPQFASFISISSRLWFSSVELLLVLSVSLLGRFGLKKSIS